MSRGTALIVLAAAAFMLVASFTALAFGLKRIDDAVVLNKIVLCNLREGYKEQLERSEAYLKKHPNGAPQISVSRADIVRTNQSLRARLKDTEVLEGQC